ncbi:uncharacterized protein LOC110023654 [Phalaenopsis equestris]|uniref:uncharacterized protein LOC110023654 n=1 Tax=Phalaenopsis equestris TaxID=78828 RepID=UPI0009E214D2|nr:uncharacterized protein LOC110023654 [Phalaenopsis equestris]
MCNQPALDHNDSDTESDSTDDSQFYHQISSYDPDEAEELGETENPAILTNGGNLEEELNPDLTGFHLIVENSIAALDLNGYGRAVGSEEEEEETMAREREASILRAFRQDESRRTAPLPLESAARIVSVMREVSFPDYAPEWVNQVPEECWLDHLRRLRGQSASQS